MFSSFLDPNFLGAFLVLYFLFVLGLFLKKKNILIAIIGILNLISIMLTYSRSAYLMLFVGLFTFLLLHGKKKLILFFISLFAVAVLTLSVVGLKSEGTRLLRITSTQARFPSAQNAITIFKNNPILGIGFNAYEFASSRYGLSKTSKFPNHAAGGTDNSFLFVLATTGIVGLVAYLFLWFEILSVSRKNQYSAVLVSSSVALFADSIFINSLFYVFIMLWVWVLAGLSET
jgi:O-antigen ligase